MSKDGPETQSIKERLTARLEETISELEDVTRSAHARLARNLQKSSTDALRQIETSMDSQFAEIVERARLHTHRMHSLLAEIEIKPRRAMRTVMITSALTGAIVAMIPWALMTWLGISATEKAGIWLERRAAITTEETRINALSEISLTEIDGQAVLMLPRATTALHICGATQTPCIRIGE